MHVASSFHFLIFFLTNDEIRHRILNNFFFTKQGAKKGKESQFYNLSFGQAVVRMYQPKSHFN